MNLEKSKSNFNVIMNGLSKNLQTEFLDWIASTWLDKEDDENEIILQEIALELRKKVPLDQCCIPNRDNYTLTIDEFLYDDKEVERLSKDGTLSLNFCKKCGPGQQTLPYELLSDSSSIPRIRHIFQTLLDPLKGCTLLDVGSGLGALLYGAYLYSNFNKIIGIEKNAELCERSRQVLETQKMATRVEVFNADIQTQGKQIAAADVVIVCNPFKYCETEVGTLCWKTIYENVKLGATLVISPPAPSTFTTYQLGIEWNDWLREIKPPEYDIASYIVTSSTSPKLLQLL